MNARSPFRRLPASKYSAYLSPAHEEFLHSDVGDAGSTIPPGVPEALSPPGTRRAPRPFRVGASFPPELIVW